MTELGITTSRAWKPNFLLPALDGEELRGEFRLVIDLCQPSGSVKLLGIADRSTVSALAPRLGSLGMSLRKAGVFATWSLVDAAGFVTGTIAGLQALQSAFFRPNVLLLRLSRGEAEQSAITEVVREGHRLGVGVALLALHERAGLGRATVINVWLRPPEMGDSVEDWLKRGNMNLGILLAYRLRRAWNGEINLICCVASTEDVERVRLALDELRDLCRLSAQAKTVVVAEPFEVALQSAPQSDMDIMGLPGVEDTAFAARMVEATRSSCLFTLDSGQENALS